VPVDLHILVPIAHRQQAEHRERVRHAQVRESQQHGSSCRSDHLARAVPAQRSQPVPGSTRADDVFGKGRAVHGCSWPG
jgi:hypothetical protein